jgi:lysozyme family protein
MKHPFEILKPEYAQLLSIMTVRPEKKEIVDHIAVKLLSLKTRWEPISAINGVPIVLMATSFEREAASNFAKNPAQGWSWRTQSSIIPHNGPFPTWQAAALEAYHLNGLDKVGRDNWTWELVCFYGEMFNGFGYRDFHARHTPYLWAMTNIQTRGKYIEDGKFDESHFDEQIGIIPVARRMVEIDPTVALPAVAIPTPAHSGLADPATTGVDTKWVQDALNKLGWQPELKVDGSYGDKTKKAVEHFQRSFGLKVDFAGPETVHALQYAIAAVETAKHDDAEAAK